ncbi:hypothetical protein Pmani_008866 [Petrolisthes manimaculis]|uniref:Peptidase S1 domain-containing protein n=1 Tax=Petrolisthes manimaculis TaxID=1843537 RepID=A0AAE1Q7J6_9EUCA|nr:hypothetical protein Pmani_008866 [Petrolisthes manimaculis]
MFKFGVTIVVFAAAVVVVVAAATPYPNIKAHQCMQKSHINESKVVGGEVVTRGETPYLISLQDNRWGGERHYCGGAIYNSHTIITAAHCVVAFNTDIFQVVAGEYDRSVTEGSEQKVGVSQAIVHPNYDSSTYENDIALLKLKHDLTFNEYVQPIQMPTKNTVVSGMCMVAGWGANVELVKQRKVTGELDCILKWKTT